MKMEFKNELSNYLLKCIRKEIDEPWEKNKSDSKVVNLSNDHLIVIPSTIFISLDFIEKIDLSNNQIKTIPSNLFCDLKNLKDLNLSNNKINELHKMTFSNLISLTSLDLSANNLTDLPNGLLNDNCYLDVMILNNNKLTIINENFSNLKKLKKLDLSRNRIEKIHSNAFKTLKCLEYLDLGRNLLENLDQNLFRECSSLQFLHLNNNKLEELAENIFLNLSSLNILTLDFNAIRNFHFKIFHQLTNLKYLSCGYNRIYQISSNLLKNLENLKEIILSGNLISELENGLFKNLPKLESIHLDRNQISTLPNDLINNLVCLKKIYLNENRIKHVPDFFFKNSFELKSIHFENNRIVSLSIDNLEYFKNNESLIDFRFNLDLNDSSLIFKRLFRFLEYDKLIEEFEIIANKVDKTGQILIRERDNVLYDRLLAYYLNNSIRFSDQKENALTKFEIAISKLKKFEWTLLDFLIFFQDFSSKNVLSLSQFIDNLLKQNSLCYNYDFRILSPDSITSLFERNDQFLLELFFPLETMLKLINSKNDKNKQLTKSDVQYIEKYLFKDTFMSLNKVNLIDTFKLILENQNETLAIHFISIIKFVYINYDGAKFLTFQQFNRKFTDEFLPKIFDISWWNLIKLIIDFAEDQNFLALLKSDKEEEENQISDLANKNKMESIEFIIVDENDEIVIDKVDRHFLKLISNTKNPIFLRHPTVQRIIKSEWEKIPRFIYYTNLIFYMFFLTFLTINIEVYKNIEYENIEKISKYICAGFVVYFLILEFVQLILSTFSCKILIYFSKIKHWLRWIFFILCILTLFLPNSEIKSSFYSITILLSYSLLLHQMNKLWKIGKYVRVVFKIVARSSGLLFIIIICIISFVISFRNRAKTFSDNEEDAVLFFNNSFELSLFRTIVMGIGSVDTNEMGINSMNKNSAINFIIYGLFIAFIPVLLINIFTGISIDEVQKLIETSKAEDALTKIDYIIAIEILKQNKFLALFYHIIETGISYFNRLIIRASSILVKVGYLNKLLSVYLENNCKQLKDYDGQNTYENNRLKIMDKKINFILTNLNQIEVRQENVLNKFKELENRFSIDQVPSILDSAAINEIDKITNKNVLVKIEQLNSKVDFMHNILVKNFIK